VLPLVLRPALAALGSLAPGNGAFDRWVSLLFYVPALTGGAFGLLGGYLIDRLGRRRVLVWSIALYTVSAFMASQAGDVDPRRSANLPYAAYHTLRFEPGRAVPLWARRCR
jgi:MFS family permease